MTALLFVARLWLAVMFAVAAGSKILDRASFRRALADFGVPRFALGPFAFGLPIVELAVAAALAPAPTAWTAAVAALVLLFLFTVAVAVTLARGRRPPCHCFGQLDSSPISWRTVGRNILLMLLVGFVVWRGQGIAIGWPAEMTAGYALAVIGAAVGLAFLVLEVSARARRNPRSGAHGAGLPPAAGLPVGQHAPNFTLPGLNEADQSLASLLAPGKRLLLAFAEPGCELCDHLLPDLARWQRELAATTTVAVISAGSAAENQPRATELHLRNVLLQSAREVADAYSIRYSPAVVLVRPDGTIGAPSAVGQNAIERLVGQLK